MPRTGLSGACGHGEGGDRAHRHDAFGAEVEHPGLLGDQLAQGGDDQRRPGHDRGEEDGGKEAQVHGDPLLPARRPGAAGS